MCKFILVIGFFAFSVAGLSQEQDPVDKKIDKKCDDIFGITIGPIASAIGGESDSYFGILLGLYFGIDLDMICFTENLRLSGGLGFSQLGSKYKENTYEPGGGGGVNNDAKLRLSYLTIPLTARYRGNKGFAAEAGLQPALLLGAKDKHANGTDDAKDLFNTFDMGIIVGAGYQPPGKKWGVGLRVVPGVTNINKSESAYQVKDKNFSTSLRVSYRL